MVSLSLLKSNCRKTIDESVKKPQTININNVDTNFWSDDKVFCDYQVKLVTDEAPVTVVEKSRQIGASYCYAFRSVLKAVSNKRDSLVTSYNKQAVTNFIRDCATWSRVFNQIFELITFSDVVNEKDVNIYEIRMLNGRRITGLAGDAVNLRGYSGRDIYLDESAYRAESLDELLAASLAAIIHSGTIRILSTHAGVQSDFNQLCEKVKKGELPYKHFRIDFKQAIADGLYKRVCVKKGEIWTPEKQEEWVESIYSMYGIRAQEELDAIPSDFSTAGKIFNRDNFKITNDTGVFDKPWEYLFLRSWDIAASTTETAFYTASVKVAYHIETQQIIVMGYTAEQLSPIDGDNHIIDVSESDGENTQFLLEQEPGSSGIKWIEQMKQSFYERGLYNITGYQPRINKIQRYLPASNAVAKGEILLLNATWNKDFKEILHRVSIKKTPLVSDVADCLGNVYDYLKNELNLMLGS